MASFIARRIINKANKSVEEGKAEYSAYFIKTHIYAAYRARVDEILEESGHHDVILVG